MKGRPRALLFTACLFAGWAMAQRTAHAAEPTTAACLAASESSLTLRHQHKLQEARAQLLICSAASCPGDVRDECIRRVGQINAAIPTIVFAAKDAAGNDLAGVKVTVDGNPIADRLDGTALPLDPGEHAVTFEAAGQPPVDKRFVIREGEKDRRERIVFRAPALATAPAPASSGPASVLVVSGGAPSEAAERGGLGTQRILAIVAAGVGVVGLGVGIGYGLESMSKHDQAHNICPDPMCPDVNGVNLWSDATSAGTVSTVAFIVGGVGLAAGAVLWFTATPASSSVDEQPTTQVVLGPGTLQLRGTW
jgi:hypothetical protein